MWCGGVGCIRGCLVSLLVVLLLLSLLGVLAAGGVVPAAWWCVLLGVLVGLVYWLAWCLCVRGCWVVVLEGR